MMKRIALCYLFITSFIGSYSQNTYVHFDITGTFESKRDTISVYKNNIYYYFFLDNSKTAYSLKAYDVNNKLLITGDYSCNNKTYFQTIRTYDSEGNVNEKRPISYIKPFRRGLWKYYDASGNVTKTKKYK